MWTEALILLVATVIIISSEIEDEVKENITITASEDEVKKNITKRRLVFPDDELFHNDEWYQKPPEYPEWIVKKVIQEKSTPFVGFFDKKDPKATTRSNANDINDTVVGLGLRNADVFTNICPDETHYIYPKRGTNKKGQSLFIINENHTEYRQSVKVTRCLSAGDTCGDGDLDTYFTTRCHQEYSDYKLVALSMSGEELIVETFQFPSCCICQVSKSWL